MERKPDIVCVSSIDWDFIWQGHQEIMSTFAAQGHRVLFLENTGVRAPQMRDLPRVRQRFKNWWRGTKGFRQERPNLFVFSPLVVPLPYSRVARWVNRWLLARALKGWMRATGLYRPIVWTFLPTPLALDLIRELDSQLTIYYCIDDFVSSSPGAKRIVASEQRLFREADLVFVTSERLRSRAAEFTDHVHLFPFGVNFARFDAIRAESPPLPDDLQSLTRPVVGYVGGLHQWVDQELLVAVAQRLPDATFAMIGPAQTDVSLLEHQPNIRLFGQRPHAELARYIRGFGVGIVPYKLSEYTANVYPTKLNEYLVMGIPVVATVLAWALPVLAGQRVLPYTRVWTFLVPLAATTAAGVYGWMLERRAWAARAGPVLAAAVAVVGSLLVLSADSVRTSRETGALLDAPAIATLLADRVEPGDRILATGSDTILEYYLERKGVDAGPLLYTDEQAARTFVVVNTLGGQTLDDLLAELDERGELTQPELLRDFDSGRVYLVRRSA